MKNKLAPILVALLALSALFFLFLQPFVALPVNSYLLRNYSNKLTSLNPPDKTVVLETGKEWGTLSGNSDHSDFFAYVVLKSDLSKEELLRYYENIYTGKSKINTYEVGSTTEIFPVTGFIQEINMTYTDTRNLYIIYLFDYDYGWSSM